MKARLSRRADQELSDAVDYLLSENPAAARGFADALEMAVRSLERYPRIGRATDILGVYVFTLTAFRYRIFYRILGDTLSIESIFHTSRDPGTSLGPE
ncbi:type II toxin-antitoxin system RelE/ParE family toxin [Amorphus orientalis]|uniref:Plasmid stabilization system protein ParE n=1 Tax=Amorphus orientalis TaxID=649198 RepID=A0AAE3VKT1_9HYPH|nr:type II toxin-antitoxin system RelE/ParE family toxin [Amorphus orientalis]MDQ0313984.1 plasmid stabilization system protein ParE [Amorphus orientalis]